MAEAVAQVAKISRPRLSGVLQRKRLFRYIDECRQRPIIWVVGPVGAGKTTLVGSYLQTRDLPSIWYQLDRSDSYIATFFYYMGQAAKQAAPRKRKKLPLLTSEYHNGLSVFTRNYFIDLSAYLKPPSCIVLDNYHEVSTASQFHELLSIGLDNIPAGTNIFILSRTEPPAAFARLQANSQLGIINWEQLQLTKSEVNGLVRMRTDKWKNSIDTEKLLERTQGWAAGIILLLEQGDDYADVPKQVGDVDRNVLFDYFAGEIFKKTDPMVQGFLLKVALLPKMTVPMAVKISNNINAGRILAYMERSQYFTTRHIQKETQFQFHPLFQEFLIAQVEKNLGAKDIRTLIKNSAELLEQDGQYEAAVRLYQKINDKDGIINIVNSHASELIRQGRHEIVMAWVEQLPDAILDKNPWCVYWLGQCLYRASSPTRIDVYDRALELFMEKNDVEGIYLSLAGLLDGLARYDEGGYAKQLNKKLTLYKELRKQYPEFPSLEIEFRLMNAITIALTFRRPDHIDIDYYIQRLTSLMDQLSGWQVFRARAELCIYYMFIGDHARVYSLIQPILGIKESSENPPVVFIVRHLVEAFYDWRCGMFEQCQENATQALTIAEKYGVHDMDHQLLSFKITALLCEEKIEEAREQLSKLEKIAADKTDVMGSRFHFMASWYNVTIGDLNKARLHADKSVEYAEHAGWPYFTSLAYLAKAGTYFECGEIIEAKKCINKSLDIAKRMRSHAVQFQSYLYKAYFEIKEGNQQAGLKALQAALTIGRENDYINCGWWRNSIMAQLCSSALMSNIEVDYVQHLIRTRNIIPETPPVDIDNWPWEIEIFGFGHCEPRRNGEYIQFSRKAQKKPMQLVGYLVAMGGQNVPEEKIIAALWPDAEGDAGHQVLTTTLHRVRKILGPETIQLTEGNLSFDPKRVWSDVIAFEQILNKADQLKTKANINERKRLIEMALSLYKGHFLNDSDASWAIPARERLRAKFLSHLEEYGRLLEKEKKWTEAVDWYRKGLEIDILAEQFYQRLMYCYEQMERLGDAVEVYRQCYRIMVASLGVEPSKATKSVYQSVRDAQ